MEQVQAFWRQFSSSDQGRFFLSRFKHYNKEGNIWTLETGCLVYTSFAIYYILASPESIPIVQKLVISAFFLGALTYFVSFSAFKKLNKAYSDNEIAKFVKDANNYIFMVLSFLPGLYFSFYFEDFVYQVYLVYHLVTSTYFLYKRFKEFELQPFMLGFGLSFALRMINPMINGFFLLFGSGWFVSGISFTIQTTIEIGIAVAFLMRLPEKYFPPNMIFGLKLLKYLMIFSSWQTWFIIMVVATWKNIGSGAQAGWESTFGFAKAQEEIRNQQLHPKVKDGKGK